jgi:hypothetical protein
MELDQKNRGEGRIDSCYLYMVLWVLEKSTSTGVVTSAMEYTLLGTLSRRVLVVR